MRRFILDAYAAHCDRQGPVRVWSTHYDIWTEPCGELGLSFDNDDWEAMAVFAAAVPFMVVPTIGCSWVVVAHATLTAPTLTLIELSASAVGLEAQSWRVPYSVSDAGHLSFDEPVRGGGVLSQNTKDAISEVVTGRAARIGWWDDIDFPTAVQIAENLMA